MKIFTKLELFLFFSMIYIFMPTITFYMTDEILRVRIFCMWALMSWKACDIRNERLEKNQIVEEDMDPLKFEMLRPCDIFILLTFIILRFIFTVNIFS